MRFVANRGPESGFVRESYLHVLHRINGEKAIEYDAPQLDPNDADAKPLLADAKRLIAAAKGELMLQRG